jgi:coenzyme F420-reducing hydrogenase gamma subunit
MDQAIQKKKLIIGWFSFTCSEDSTILFTELLNTHFDEWKNLIEFRYFKALQSKNLLENLDVAFIEGAISSESQTTEVKKIRNNAKYVVAIGACACTGMPSASRNEFANRKIDEKICWYMNQFNYNEKVKRLDEVIKVDDKVNGCPMNVSVFLETLKKYLTIFKIVQ